MVAFAVTYCFICKHEKVSYYVHVGVKAFGICFKCWKLATKLHQLNLNEETNR